MSSRHFRDLICLTVLWSISLTVFSQVPESDPLRDARELMVRTQIENRGVEDERVLQSLREVPRHLFIEESLWSMAYSDTPLPISNGQTISQPYIVALMTELLETGGNHTVLEIGTGSGYQAAVLSGLVAQVYTIEIVPELGRRAEQTLNRLGYENVSVRIGDGYQGWPEHAPFDRIIVTAAPEEIPQALVDQLKPGGRMVLPVGAQISYQELMVLEKDEAGNVSTYSTLPVRFVPMVREPDR
ncbi:MAG: protein-L-isoaspartate(D-aspartate) O-methyltransferase [Gammaproteobacteria bacterium]|nr:protein-L-isoaspartate(D-aspartate) O-methyltransferase [Gammaproteobacteria bacterium]